MRWIPLALFWGLAAVLLLLYQLSDLPGPLTLWAYAITVTPSATMAAAYVAGRTLRCGRSRWTWVGGWLLMGGAAAVATVLVGLVTFAVDMSVRSGEPTAFFSEPLLGGAILLYIAVGMLGLAVLEAALLGLITTPLVLAARAWLCRPSARS